MSAIFDNLIASVVFAAVILTLLGLQNRMAKANVDEVVYTSMKNQSVEFSSWLERDFMQAGSQVEGIFSGDPFVLDSVGTAGLPLTRTFTLQHRPRLGQSNGNRIRYTLELREPPSTYVLKRYVNGVLGGESPELSYFQVDFVDDNFQVVNDPQTNWEQVENIFFRYEIVPMTDKYSGLPVFYTKAVMLNQ